MAGSVMTFEERERIVNRLKENHASCIASLRRTRRYDLQKQLEGRIAAYEVALRLHGVCVDAKPTNPV